MDDLKELIKESYQTLPNSIKEMLGQSDMKEKLNALAAKHSLDEPETEILKNEVLLIMLGIEPISRFKENLSEQLEISSDKINLLILDVTDEIFAPVEDVLNEMDRAMDEDAEKEDKPGQINESGKTEKRTATFKNLATSFEDTKITTLPNVTLPNESVKPSEKTESKSLENPEVNSAHSEPLRNKDLAEKLRKENVRIRETLRS